MSLLRTVLAGLALGVATDGRAGVAFETITSAALGRPMPVAVVLPSSPVPRGGFPVLFLLHGRGRTHRSLIDVPETRRALEASPFCVVLPQGEDGWYVDAPVPSGARHESHLTEVLAWAGRALPVSVRAERRGIAGWSMGGYGAVRYATRHPEAFGFVASIIGLLDFPRPATLPEGRNYAVPVARFTADPAVWERYNPLPRAAALAGRAVTLVLATRGFERTMNENFVAALVAAGGRPHLHHLEGGHDFALVGRAVPLVLADAADFFSRDQQP